MREASIFFLSDAHLGAEPESLEAARQARLHSFLETLPGRASTLYIVGDLFDFWFEYRTAIPRRLFRTLAVLESIKRAGVEIVRTQLQATFGLRTYDVADEGLVVWPGPGFETQVVYPLQGKDPSVPASDRRVHRMRLARVSSIGLARWW